MRLVDEVGGVPHTHPGVTLTVLIAAIRAPVNATPKPSLVMVSMGVPEDRDAAFVAKIAASVTHEIRNVLAIIKESAGLVGDVIQSQGGRAPANPDKVVRAVGRIDAQVSRGAEILTNLNRFAHSLDRLQGENSLNQEVEQTAFLSQRFARHGRHQVQVHVADQDMSVGANPLWLQMALFAAVECCLDQLPEASTVTIRTGLH